MLTPPQSELLSALSVFAGFDVPGAVTMLPDADVVDGLEGLCMAAQQDAVAAIVQRLEGAASEKGPGDVRRSGEGATPRATSANKVDSK